MVSAALALEAVPAPPVAEATPRARARRRNMEGGEEEELLLSWSLLLEAATATRRADRGATLLLVLLLLLLRAALVLRAAIRDGLFDTMKERVIVGEKDGEAERRRGKARWRKS